MDLVARTVGRTRHRYGGLTSHKQSLAVNGGTGKRTLQGLPNAEHGVEG